MNLYSGTANIELKSLALALSPVRTDDRGPINSLLNRPQSVPPLRARRHFRSLRRAQPGSRVWFLTFCPPAGFARHSPQI